MNLLHRIRRHAQGQIRDVFRGRRALQPLYETLLRHALAGLNIGGGGAVQESGERWVLEYLARRLTSAEPVVFDVGANTGVYARAVLSSFPAATRLHCFEPSKRAFEALEAAVGGRAICHPFGFSDEEDGATLYSDAERSGLASVYGRRLDHVAITLAPAEQIQLTTIDAFCRTGAIRHIDFLKLDVEGHELAVLRGAAGMLGGNAIDVIQFEFGGCNIDSRTYFQDFFYLLSPAFRLFRVLVDGIRPIERYDETAELFLTTNYLAMSRRLNDG